MSDEISPVGSIADNRHMEPVPLSVAINEVMAALIERHFEKDEES